jgi:hypothetical protein
MKLDLGEPVNFQVDSVHAVHYDGLYASIQKGLLTRLYHTLVVQLHMSLTSFA